MKLLASITLVAAVVFSIPAPAHAFGVPFGGVITVSVPCTCSAGQLLTVVGPIPGTYLMQPGISTPFLFGSFYKPGAFIIGNFVGGGVCLTAGTPCGVLPVTGTITIFGTSQ